jgi:ADP-glucose pyrophosphorylase
LDVVRSVLSPDVDLADGVAVHDSVLMPGVRVGKGARLRRTIVEEGVHIPAGFVVGFDLDHDRQRHTVTGSGVVVVSETPTNTKSVVRFAVPDMSGRVIKTIERDRSLRVTA